VWVSQKQQQVLAVALFYKMSSITFCRYNVKLPHWLNFLRSQACRSFLSHSQTTRDFIKNPERFPNGLVLSSDGGVAVKGKNSKHPRKGSASAAAASASHLSSGGPTTFTLAERQRSAVEAAAAALEEEDESSEEEEEEERPRKKKKKKKSSAAAAASAAADGE
jgi:hypothetical protein